MSVAESLRMIQREGLGPQEDTVIVALTYRCNSACTFCIIATEIGQRLVDTPASVLEEVFAFNRTRRLRRGGPRTAACDRADAGKDS